MVKINVSSWHVSRHMFRLPHEFISKVFTNKGKIFQSPCNLLSSATCGLCRIALAELIFYYVGSHFIKSSDCHKTPPNKALYFKSARALNSEGDAHYIIDNCDAVVINWSPIIHSFIQFLINITKPCVLEFLLMTVR